VHVAGEIAQNYFVDSYFPTCLLDKAELMYMTVAKRTCMKRAHSCMHSLLIISPLTVSLHSSIVLVLILFCR
jgi:hypothetical protein